jgi:GNAT superfamily N-acetyltransferase
MLTQRIEEAALNAWPALQQMLYDGWIVRFSQGYTKRANSVTPLYTSTRDTERNITACERLYARQGLPPIFRLTSFAAPPDLAGQLEARGYRILDPTQVLYRRLSDTPPTPGKSAALRTEPLDTWIDLFCDLRQAPLEQHQTHKAMLAAIPTQTCFAALWVGNTPVACGLGVLEDDCFGLFDLITAPAQRNQGYGSQIVAGLLAWAHQRGARHAYLQVVESNAPARHVYEAKFGFEPLYGYHYYVPAAT